MLLLVVLLVSVCAFAQSSLHDNDKRDVLVANFSAPSYPPLALTARISGDVKLNVSVRANGSIESVAAISGHPMLIKAALDSAQQSEFQCNNCVAMRHYTITYKFELGDTTYCSGIDATGNAQFEAHQQEVSQTQDTVTIIGHPVGTCDPTASITFVKIRSPKCLFLWHCSRLHPL